MKISIVETFILIIFIKTVKGDISYFIISNESDLKRFESGNRESIDEVDLYDYDNEMDMYDMCNGGDVAQEFLSSYDYVTSADGNNEFDFSVDSLENILNTSPKKFKKLLENLAWDPRYAALIDHINRLEDIRYLSNCESESNVDMYIGDQYED